LLSVFREAGIPQATGGPSREAHPNRSTQKPSFFVQANIVHCATIDTAHDIPSASSLILSNSHVVGAYGSPYAVAKRVRVSCKKMSESSLRLCASTALRMQKTTVLGACAAHRLIISVYHRPCTSAELVSTEDNAASAARQVHADRALTFPSPPIRANCICEKSGGIHFACSVRVSLLYNICIIIY